MVNKMTNMEKEGTMRKLEAKLCSKRIGIDIVCPNDNYHPPGAAQRSTTEVAVLRK